jgi:secretion/DNA translocation related TadE-like protein
MRRSVRNESGQISILVLAILLALLATTCLIGAIAQVVLAQQRLNTKAESIALAGAQELEFNQAQACDVAREFSTTNYGLIVDCISEPESISILVSQPNPNSFARTFFPSIYASSRAGIVANESINSVD